MPWVPVPNFSEETIFGWVSPWEQTYSVTSDKEIWDGKYKSIGALTDRGLNGEFIERGENSMGIYLVEDTETQKRFTCKLLYPIGLAKHEGEILAKVSPHPNITAYVDCITDEYLQRGHFAKTDRIYMEYCDRGTLEDLFWPGAYCTPAEPFILSVFRDLTAAVKHLQYGSPGANDWDPIIHRDIKPSNVFLTTTGAGENNFPRAVLGDFGCAFTMTEIKEIEADYENRSNDVGVLHDNLYMDPLDNASLDPSADVYQIAMVIYYLCNHGQVEHRAKWGTDVLDCSDELKEIVRRCISSDWEERLDILDLETWLANFGKENREESWEEEDGETEESSEEVDGETEATEAADEA